MLELAARLRELPRDELAAALLSREFDPRRRARPLRPRRAPARLPIRSTTRSAASTDDASPCSPRPPSSPRRRRRHHGRRRAMPSSRGSRHPTISPSAPELSTALAASLLVVRADDAVHRPVGGDRPARAARSATSLPSTAELAAAAPPVLVTADEIDRSMLERRAAETAYATVAATAELLSELGTQPARELAKGGLALPDSKRLAEASGTALDALPRLFHRADEAGLVAREGAFWLESDLGAAWALESASGPLAAPGRVLARPHSRAAARTRRSPHRHPHRCDPARRRALVLPGGRALDRRRPRPAARRSRALGLAVAGEPVETGRLVLAGQLDEAAERARGALPRQQVDRVYLQHDLTIVSPGPLEPPLDARLRAIADVEGRDLASTYRVSAASVNRALAAGETADDDPSSSSAGSRSPGSPSRSQYLRRRGGGAVRRGAGRRRRRPRMPRRTRSIRSDDEQLVRHARGRPVARVARPAPDGPAPPAVEVQPRRRVLGPLRRALPRRRRRRRRPHRAAAAPPRSRRRAATAAQDRPDRRAARPRARGRRRRCRPSRRGSRASSRPPPGRRRRSPSPCACPAATPPTTCSRRRAWPTADCAHATAAPTSSAPCRSRPSPPSAPRRRTLTAATRAGGEQRRRGGPRPTGRRLDGYVRRPPHRAERPHRAARGRAPRSLKTRATTWPSSPSSSAHPSTCTPTASRASACGTRAPPATTPTTCSARSSGTRSSRCRRRCRRHARDRRPLRPPRDRPHRRGRPAAALRPTSRCSPRSPAHNASHRCSPSASTTRASSWRRGRAAQLKQELVKLGWPAEDLAGYTPGTPHEIELDQADWHLRDYQQKAIDNFFDGGSGVVVLPCGAGKTLVGAGAMATAKTTTLILVTNTVSARQWRDELLQPHEPDRRRDRRVLGSGERGQAGHDRDVPDPHREAKGRVRAPRAARRARLGPRGLRRGAPAAGARVQAHRRAPGATPPRPHRDARARRRA